ncbi:MAG: glycerol-3-phosphate responsive antiterminator [Rubrobacteraceae bacterium]
MGRDHNLSRFLRALKVNPVIPAVRGPDEDLERALAGDHAAIFVLGGDVFRVLELAARRRHRRPFICVNVDMVGGIAADASGIKFLSGGADGIISTRRHVIELAKGRAMITIQRLFAIDSSAISRGVKLIRHADPDCLEILPGIAYPAFASDYQKDMKQPVLAGGLIKDKHTVSEILDAGATGISTSEKSLWKMA